MVEMNGFEPLRFLQNGFTVRRLQPLGHISLDCLRQSIVWCYYGVPNNPHRLFRCVFRIIHYKVDDYA